MMGRGTTEPKERPSWLESALEKSKYYQEARKYYGNHAATNSLYVEVTPDGQILFYDGWQYKRGMQEGKRGLLQQAEIARISVDRDKWQAELASAISFARRARKEFGWNVIPVFNGEEVDVRVKWKR